MDANQATLAMLVIPVCMVFGAILVYWLFG